MARADVCKPLIRPAELDQRVRFEIRAPGQDELGNADGNWTLAFEAWAKAEPLRGRELFAQGQMVQAADTRFTIRYRPDVTPRHRIVWRGQAFELVGPPIDVKARRQALEIMATTGVRDGR